MRSAWYVLLLLAACGGGGGGASLPPAVTTALTFRIEPVEIAPSEDKATITFQFVDVPSPPPVLLRVRLRLPPELQLASTDRLIGATPLVTLDGGQVGEDFVILCGDTVNADAPPLPAGPLFRLGVRPTAPRQPGTYDISVLAFEAATASGDPVPVGPALSGSATVTVE